MTVGYINVSDQQVFSGGQWVSFTWLNNTYTLGQNFSHNRNFTGVTGARCAVTLNDTPPVGKQVSVTMAAGSQQATVVLTDMTNTVLQITGVTSGNPVICSGHVSSLESDCEDQRQYTDDYYITLNGTNKDGSPIALTSTQSILGGSEYQPVFTPSQTSLPSILNLSRATIRAKNGSSKNGQVSIYARIFKVSIDPFGLITDPVGTLFSTVLIGKFQMTECKRYGTPIGGDGFSITSPISQYCYDIFLTIQGMNDSGQVCCDDDSDEEPAELERPPQPIDITCDCDFLIDIIMQLHYRLTIVEGRTPLKGEKGDKGDKGDDGLDGEQGIQGIQGEQGIQGIQGEQGIQGIQGIQGEPGIGWAGQAGAVGPQGIQGEQGIQGIQGEQGIQGIQGEQGIQGIQGEKGDSGSDGVDGINGIDGVDGVSIAGPLTFEEYMTIEQKLQLIADSLVCGDRGIACIVEKGVIKPETDCETEKGLVEIIDDVFVVPSYKDQYDNCVPAHSVVKDFVENYEPVQIENEYRTVSHRVIDNLDSTLEKL